MAPEQAGRLAQDDRAGGRRLCPGGDPLRDARPAGRRSRREQPLETLRAGHDRRAGPAVAAAAQAAARPRDDLPEVPAEGAGRALRQPPRRWPTTCGGSWRAGRSWRGGAVGAERPGGGAGAIPWLAGANIAAAALAIILAVGATIAAWSFYAPARPDQPDNLRDPERRSRDARKPVRIAHGPGQATAVQPPGGAAVREPRRPGPGGRDRTRAQAAAGTVRTAPR